MIIHVWFNPAIRLAYTSAVVTVLALFAGSTVAEDNDHHELPAYTCTGGDLTTPTYVSIPSGHYESITIKGVCNVAPNAVIHVEDSIHVDTGATFDATNAPSTITVERNVTAAPEASVGLGCLPNPEGHTTGHPCAVGGATAQADITIHGDVFGGGVDYLGLYGVTVQHDVIVLGGAGSIPWAVKDNKIRGSLVIEGATPNWLGLEDNTVGGSVLLRDIEITDTDPSKTIFIASNKIGKNLVCEDIGPNVAAGFPGEFNVVGGKALGQCADLVDVTP